MRMRIGFQEVRGMVVAAFLGLLAGAVSFLPLLLGQKIMRTTHLARNLGQVGALLLGVFVSVVILGGLAFICITFARDLAVPFSLGEVVGLIVATATYGVTRLARRKK